MDDLLSSSNNIDIIDLEKIKNTNLFANIIKYNNFIKAYINILYLELAYIYDIDFDKIDNIINTFIKNTIITDIDSNYNEEKKNYVGYLNDIILNQKSRHQIDINILNIIKINIINIFIFNENNKYIK